MNNSISVCWEFSTFTYLLPYTAFIVSNLYLSPKKIYLIKQEVLFLKNQVVLFLKNPIFSNQAFLL